MKKLLCSALAAVMLSAVALTAFSCADDVVSAENETTEPVTEDLYGDNLPEKNLEGADFTIFAAAEDWIDEYYIETTSGDVVEDAVYARNRSVEDRFGVKLQYVVKNGYGAGMSDVSAALTGSVMGGSGEYDLVVINSAYISGRILENIFVDLKKLDYLDFSQPWWISGVNDEVTIDGKLYIGAGKYSLSSVKRSWALFFNKNLAEAYSLGNLYDEVAANTWVYDRWLEYAAQVSEDLDGNGKFNANDRYGIVGTSIEPFWATQFSLGRRLTVIGSDGLPELTGATEQVCDIFDKLQSLRYDSSLYYGTTSYDVDDGLIPMLVADQSLFSVYTLHITSYAGMREVDNYGILPLPKYNEQQESFYSQCNVDFCCVLKVTPNDFTNVGLITEALNAENYRSVIPKYYEIALTRKYTRDDESAAMLDIICAGSTLDFGTVFYSQVGTDLFIISNLFTKSGRSFATYWAEHGPAAEAALQEVIDTLKSFD